MKDLIPQVFSIDTPQSFEKVCLDVFNYQAENCAVYREYISHLGIVPQKITQSAQIPYLPVSFFKTHNIISNTDPVQIIFSSSGTTGMSQSQHLVTDVLVYEKSFNLAFEQFYGEIENTCFLALLPSYQERDGSSLIYMVDALIGKSRHPDSGYFLHNHTDLFEKLKALKLTNQKTILIGVTYALLDFVDQHHIDFPNLLVMETGGMKGKRKEMVREELHQTLQDGFGISAIHSEYGMTELLSQAYSFGNGIFNCPPWMKIQLRETNDPLSAAPIHKTGGINIIDLANINSCSFIATQDLGKIFPDGSFEVLGRFDNADIRGCNLLVN
ncbi:LuxE/PaaK family acyltransferase [Pedobacter metabolipauper]|uniref:LuxE/PaaK family acyltransferase n=1 Tax=Pedobacter metabolipauper TaxID=425513 RepID=UPI001061E44C|nr:acyl transferase [Pedobacter metabolipauper]